MKIDATTFAKLPDHLKALFIKAPNPGSEEVLAGFPQAGGGSGKPRIRDGQGSELGQSAGWNSHDNKPTQSQQYADTGSAARFFYCAKASKRDRDEGLEGFDLHAPIHGRADQTGNNKSLHVSGSNTPRANVHPTVKPTDLMAYLCRLVTPPGGIVLDLFTGSGSTGKAAIREGFRFVGCEMSPEYMEIARARIQHEVDKIEAARRAPEPATAPQLDMFA